MLLHMIGGTVIGNQEVVKKTICKNCWLKQCAGECSSIHDRKKWLKNKIVRFRKGDDLINSDINISGLYCIKDGFVKIYKKGLNDKEFIIWIATRGEIVGLDSFLNNEQFAFSAKALNDVTTCHISTSEMECFLNRKPLIINELMRNLCNKIDLLEKRIVFTSKRKKKDQIADFLLLLSKQTKEKTNNQLNQKHSIPDIIKMMGISQSYYKKILKEFKKNGINEIDKNILV